MHQLGTEEKAALLLAETDDDDEQMDLSPTKSNNTTTSSDQFPVIAKRPRTYQRSSTSNSQSLLCLVFILLAFLFGCVSGVVVMLYRMAQDAEHSPSTATIHSTLSSPMNNYQPDLTVQTKLFQSLNQTNLKNLNHSVTLDLNVAKKIFDQWKSFTPGFTTVKSVSYPISLGKLSASGSWNGIEMMDAKTGDVVAKFDGLSNGERLSLFSLFKSGSMNVSSIYYVNYGREEDFAYLFHNRIFLQDASQAIVFMRRKSSLISMTEQIRHAIHFRFAALVLFDDTENDQITTTNDRDDAFRAWARARNPPISRLIYGISTGENQTISVLTVSLVDVQRLFASLQPDSNSWLSSPAEWHEKATPLKIGGSLSTFQFRFTSQFDEISLSLPMISGSIRGSIDPEHFLLVGYPMEVIQQNEMLNEVLRSFFNQMTNGWKPKRSILFCAWSGLDFDHYTLRRWLKENSDLINGHLIGYIDLGHGVRGNGTLNLHGSFLFEDIARRAAQFVPSPFQQNQTCSPRTDSSITTTTMRMNEESHGHAHEHGRRRREETICQTDRLLDQWMKISNRTRNLVQMADLKSAAAILQLEYGYPSLLIEMIDAKDVNYDSFYGKIRSTNEPIDAPTEVSLAYAQYLTEILRQLIDEPFIGFNLTIYADQLQNSLTDYLTQFQGPYQSLGYHLGDPSLLKNVLGNLTKTMRQIQSEIDQTAKNDIPRLFLFNEKLMKFESFFLLSNDTFPIDDRYKHSLIGPAFGLTNTAVPFPSLSNLLYNIPFDPSEEFCNAAVIYSSQLRDHFQRMARRLDLLHELF